MTNTHQIGCKVSAETKEGIKEVAQREHRSIAQTVRVLLMEACEQGRISNDGLRHHVGEGQK